MAKGAVCKTAIRRFDSARHLRARVAELADALGLSPSESNISWEFDPPPEHHVGKVNASREQNPHDFLT